MCIIRWMQLSINAIPVNQPQQALNTKQTRAFLYLYWQFCCLPFSGIWTLIATIACLASSHMSQSELLPDICNDVTFTASATEELQKSTTDPHGVLPQKLYFDTFFKNLCHLKQSKGRIGLLHRATCMICLENVILEEFDNYNKFNSSWSKAKI